MHLLLALGSTDSVDPALRETVERAEAAGDDLTVALYGDPGDRETLSRTVHEHLATADVSATVREISEDPASRIVELAEREGVDRIVLPGGQKSPLGKIRIDDVTEFVLLNATTTVTLIR